MAGSSSRFSEQGFSVPKYKLPLWSKFVFDYVVLSFREYFKSHLFLFITRKDLDKDCFVRQHASKLGIEDFIVEELSTPTLGQAHTVFLGLHQLCINRELIIFNIDTIRRAVILPSFADRPDGYCECAELSGDHWSFIEPGEGSLVKSITEKIRISKLCSTGLYYFRESRLFIEAFRESFSETWTYGERYVAPLYNYIIKSGGSVRYYTVDATEVLSSGTPKEYLELLNRPPPE